MEKLVLIDGNSIMNRAFYGIMGSKMLTTKDGTYTNAVYGFLAILFKLLEDLKPEYIVVAFDLKAPTARHKMYEGYKANRHGMPEELAQQMPIIKEILKAMNIDIVEKEGYEADDVLGTLSRYGEKQGLEVTILSGDRDTFQLATDKVTIRIPRTKAGKTETEEYNREKIKQTYGIEPKQLIEVKGLQGDTSDNIPGVPGIGEKTALSLIQKYGTIENLYEENFNIYMAFTSAEEQLYLSYASTDSEGKSLRPSMLIIKLKKIYLSLKEESDVITKKYEITNKNVTYEQLLENIYKLNENEQIDDIWYMVYNYYKNQNDYQISLKNDLEGLEYTNLPKDIDKKIVDKLYGNTLNTSVSRLEKYRSCPFSYYLQYGLKLKEKEELKVQSFNTGSFMHETIDSFFQLVREENLSLAQLMTDEEMIEKLVAQIIEEKLKLSSNYIFTATSKYKILVKRLKKIITKALKYIIEGLVYSEFDIQGTEVEFSNKGKYKPIILNLEDGKKVEITGKIDRIDTAQNEDGKYLRIIDYKSSAKNIDLNEVYAGLQIQLLTYLDAVCKQEDLMPAGILYFSLLEQMVKSDKKITEEEIENEIRKNFKMKGLIVADVKIIKLHDKILETGSSKIVPAAITSSGEVNKKWTSGVSKEEFKVLQDDIQKIIKDIAKEILSGKIDLKPYNKKGRTPCKYCEYKAICGFNTKNPGNCYNYI